MNNDSLNIIKLEIAKYEPERGDLLIFRVSKNTTLQQIDDLAAALSEVVPQFVKSIVVYDDIQIEVVKGGDTDYPPYIYER